MIDKPNNNTVDHTNTDIRYKKADSKKTKGAGFALFIAFIALFLTTAGIAAGYKHWQRMHDRAKNNARKIEILEQALTAKSDVQSLEQLRREITEIDERQKNTADNSLQEMSRLNSQTRQFADTVASQVEHITSLQTQLQKETTPNTTKGWQLAEVGFLLKLAIRELNLAHNPTAAIEALKEADQLLSEAGSTHYIPVRQQIASDINTIENSNIPEVTNISLKINALLKSLKPDNSTRTTDTKTHTTTNTDDTQISLIPSPENTNSSRWSGYKEQAIKTLNGLVVKRKVDNPIAATLSSDAKHHLYHLLQSRLETLHLMALQRSDTAYHQQIGLIRETINTYYMPEQSAHLLAELDALDSINLQPELPDISGGLRLLNAPHTSPKENIAP